MTNPGSVRRATSADAVCLSALATQVFFETYASSGISAVLAREAQAHFRLQAIEALLGDVQRTVLLVERAEHLIAFAEVVHRAGHELVGTSEAAELARLYVQGPFLRRGVGQLLLGRSEALARELGASTLWLTAWVGNARALAFYASQGYRELGSTPYVFEGKAFENRLFAKALGAGA